MNVSKNADGDLRSLRMIRLQEDGVEKAAGRCAAAIHHQFIDSAFFGRDGIQAALDVLTGFEVQSGDREGVFRGGGHPNGPGEGFAQRTLELDKRGRYLGKDIHIPGKRQSEIFFAADRWIRRRLLC